MSPTVSVLGDEQRQLETAAAKGELSQETLEDYATNARAALTEVATSSDRAIEMSAVVVNSTVGFMLTYLDGIRSMVEEEENHPQVLATIDTFVEMVTNFTAVFVEHGADQTTLEEPLIESIDESILGATRELVDLGTATTLHFEAETSRVHITVVQDDADIAFEVGVAASFVIPAGTIGGSHSNGSLVAASFQEFEDTTVFPHNLNESIAQIGSSVISVLVTEEMQGTVEGVFDFSFNLQIAVLLADVYVPQCVWYDVPEGGGDVGSWSTVGCITSQINATHCKCTCNHLTSFAVLVSSEEAGSSGSSDAADHETALSVITYVGVTLSLAGIVMTIGTVLAVRQMRKQLRYQILLNLVTALGLALFFFCLLTVPTSSSECEVVSFGAVYFFVASLLWNFVEAYDLYRTFCVVFHDGQARSSIYMQRFSVFAWGGALVPPTIAMVLDRPNFITTGQTASGSQPTLCWINMATQQRWAFLGPVAIVVITNMVIALLIFRTIRVHTTHRSHTSVLYTTKIVASVSAVTGLTWIFAVLVVATKEVAFSYVFTIFASTQGATIFYFHVYHNELSMQAWKSAFAVLTGASCDPRSRSKGKAVRARPRSTAWSLENSKYATDDSSRAVHRPPRRSAAWMAQDYSAAKPTDQGAMVVATTGTPPYEVFAGLGISTLDSNRSTGSDSNRSAMSAPWIDGFSEGGSAENSLKKIMDSWNRKEPPSDTLTVDDLDDVLIIQDGLFLFPETRAVEIEISHF